MQHSAMALLPYHPVVEGSSAEEGKGVLNLLFLHSTSSDREAGTLGAQSLLKAPTSYYTYIN